MKKLVMISILSISLLLYGCQNKADSEVQNEDTGGTEMSGAQGENVRENSLEETEGADASGEEASGAQDENAESTEASLAVQDGPYGQLSLVLPAGWEYEACPVDSDKLHNGMYGIRFYPEGVTEGCIELAYVDSFGVCGTGLSTEETVIAGSSASVGTFDNHEYWDFISFRDEYEGVVVFSYSAEGWWSQYEDQVSEILDTLVFDSGVKEGGAYVYSQESEAEEIGLQLSLKNVSATGATLVFNQYDKEAPTGELEFGAEYTLEQLKDGKWEELPGPVEGSESENYVFNDVAYLIKPESETEKEVEWEWLHGPLDAGEYRIKKTVHDFRGTGDFDEYTVYAQFVVN